MPVWAPLCPPIVPVHYCCRNTHHDTPWDRRHTEKSVHLLLQTTRALRRGAPCLVRKVNCAFNRAERSKTLMAMSAREDVAGGSTAISAAVLTTSRRTASAARALPGLASAKRQQLTVLGRDHQNARQLRVLERDHLNARRTRAVGARRGVLVRARTTTRSLIFSSCWMRRPLK